MSTLTGFAEACYDTNSIAELEEALTMRAADKTDCEKWAITPTQWRAAIAEALAAKRDAAGITPEAKRPGAPTKPPAEIARTRATRWTDADWADLKLVTMDRVRELVRREAAKMRARKP